jgi:hypothetical protein
VSYRCGISPGMSDLGLQPRNPHVVCDGCGLINNGIRRDGGPMAWLRNGKAPKGWMLNRTEREDGSVDRKDWCPRCRETRVIGGGP